MRQQNMHAAWCFVSLMLVAWHTKTALAFLNIAHMVTTPQALLWAVDQMGANAVEMDLAFQDRPESAVPIRFRHSPDKTTICDCWCDELHVDGVPHVCSKLNTSNSRDLTDDLCMVSYETAPLLNLIATKRTIAMVYIDSKIDQVGSKYSQDKLFKTGQNVYALLDRELVKKGFKGKVLISAGTIQYKAYLQGAWAAAKAAKAKNFFFTIDMDKYDAAYTALRDLKRDGASVMYSKGLTTCVVFSWFREEITKAAKDPMFNETIIWTLDNAEYISEYMNYGATGILTNKPYRVYAYATSRNLFATRTKEDVPPSRPTINLTCQQIGCDCTFTASGGCVIDAEAMSGCACRCNRSLLTCNATAVPCNRADGLCSRPGIGVASCHYGGGNCGGYKEACNCDYTSGGCVISKAAPPNTACRCRYTGFWSCTSELTRCADYGSPVCASPGTDLRSCQQGGGNCGGYK